MKSVKILIADAQYLARAGFTYLFEDDERLSIVGEAVDPDDMMEEIREKRPDLVIFDYHDSNTFSIDDILNAGILFPDVRFLVVTAENNKNAFLKLLEYGVKGILTKNCSREEIVGAVHSVLKGEKFFCNKVLDILLEKHIVNTSENCDPSILSLREQEITGLIARGVTTKDIAEQLCLSTHTVYTHRKNIMKKLRISSVSELVLYAVNVGIVETQA